MRRPGQTRLGPAALAGIVLAAAACDDQIKYISIFSTMSEQPSLEAYEEAPRTAPEGTMPIDGERSLGLLEADALVSPLTGTAKELARGRERFGQFCTPCHGPTGRGDGSVVGPNRLPPIPTLNLHSPTAVAYSDGYVWGMIANGRGLMPSYRRIPSNERWAIVLWVRELQRTNGAVEPDAEGGGSR